MILFVRVCNTFCLDTFCPSYFQVNTFCPDTFCPTKNKGQSKEYVCIAELLVYCRRMEVRRNDNELKMGIYKCVIIKLLH